MINDKQKLLISSLYMMKKDNNLSDEQKSFMVADYEKSLNVSNVEGFYTEIKKCEKYFVVAFGNFIMGNSDYDTCFCRLKNVEQYILAEIEMMFMVTTGVTNEQKQEFLGFVCIQCDIQKPEEILLDVETQINDIELFIDYWRANKK